MEANHTPGPWLRHPDVSDGETSVFNQKGTEHIAEVINEKNASLIEAAPELLDALKSAISELTKLNVRYFKEAYALDHSEERDRQLMESEFITSKIERAKAIIKKATE